jgi:hypothetical protein
MRANIIGALLVILTIGLLGIFTGTEGFVDAGRCGVGLAPCAGRPGMHCMNGYCKGDNPPTLPPFSDLPIRPAVWPGSAASMPPADNRVHR